MASEQKSRYVRFVEAHERLKHRIHNFRMPIHNKYMRNFVGFLYFAVPSATLYYMMRSLKIEERVENLDEAAEKLGLKPEAEANALSERQQASLDMQKAELDKYLKQIRDGAAEPSRWGGYLK